MVDNWNGFRDTLESVLFWFWYGKPHGWLPDSESDFLRLYLVLCGLNLFYNGEAVGRTVRKLQIIWLYGSGARKMHPTTVFHADLDTFNFTEAIRRTKDNAMGTFVCGQALGTAWEKRFSCHREEVNACAWTGETDCRLQFLSWTTRWSCFSFIFRH